MDNLKLYIVKKITVITVYIILLFFVFFPATVFSANKCSTLGEKLRKIYDKRVNKLIKHRDMLSKIRTKWESVLNAYKSNNCDVKYLQWHVNDLVKLGREWGNTWEKNYDLYIYSLQTARSFACSNQKSAFRSEMVRARDFHKALLNSEKTYSQKIEMQIGRFISKDITAIKCPTQ